MKLTPVTLKYSPLISVLPRENWNDNFDIEDGV